MWRKRWLVLHADARLAYYRNERSTKPIRVIDLCKCTRVDCGKRKAISPGEMTEIFCLSKSTPGDRKNRLFTFLSLGLEHKKYKYIFDVVLKSRTYFFSARDQTEMEEWVGAVCRLRSVASGGTRKRANKRIVQKDRTFSL